MTTRARPLAVMRWSATTAAAVAFVAFAAAFLAELLSPGAPRTKALFWAGVATLLVTMVLLAVFAAILSRFRGLAPPDRSRAARYWLWGGPIGLFWVVWVLTDPRKGAPFFSPR